jgi:hypothetical protein
MGCDECGRWIQLAINYNQGRMFSKVGQIFIEYSGEVK